MKATELLNGKVDQRPLTVGVLTVQLTLRDGRLAAVALPKEVPAGVSPPMLADLQSALARMPLQWPTAQPFTRRVWETMQTIPFGETITYQELATRAGSPRGARAVGAACGANRLLLVVPCHRVVAGSGLGGFGPGLEWKRTLLALEAMGSRETIRPREAFATCSAHSALP